MVNNKVSGGRRWGEGESSSDPCNGYSIFGEAEEDAELQKVQGISHYSACSTVLLQ